MDLKKYYYINGSGSVKLCCLNILVFVSILFFWSHAAAQTLRRTDFAEKCGWHPGDSVVVVPAGVNKIPAYAFADMSEVRRVRFASGSELTAVGSYAFLGCTALYEIELPATVTLLEDGCFRDCSSLTEIKIPSGVRIIPSQAFRGCRSLRTVTLPGRLQKINSFAFIYCSNLQAINFPVTLTKIGNNAFSMCGSLEEVVIPDGVRALESYAFSSCTRLREVTLPGNSAELGELIFSGCSSLEIIREPSKVPPHFECNSYLFDPDDEEAYRRCKLIVPPGKRSSYASSHAWNLFLE